MLVVVVVGVGAFSLLACVCGGVGQRVGGGGGVQSTNKKLNRYVHPV